VNIQCITGISLPKKKLVFRKLFCRLRSPNSMGCEQNLTEGSHDDSRHDGELIFD
jgi:hypothetical protein